MIPIDTVKAKTASLIDKTKADYDLLFPGILISIVVAVSAQFLSEHYQTPAMLLALLLGIALGFLGEEGKTVPGVAFSAKTLLRIGVALLGVRISVAMVSGLGLPMICLIVGSVAATILFGLLISRWFGHRWRFALLTAGSVAICGASAAVAISAILPKDERSEERLAFTVMGVTVLSTLAMIVYPIITEALKLDDFAAGLFFGATIHDVAQVVGAGFTVSDEAGDAATVVKLIRVALLGPVVIIGSLVVRRFATIEKGTDAPPIMPLFILGFLLLATLNSLNFIPQILIDFLSSVSRWFLLTAIAAVGMRTNLKQVMSVGGPAIALIFVETVFIAIVILTGIYFLHH